MRAKKHLGQHFLTSKKALNDIVSAAELRNTDVVIEIGPGKGVLTEALIEHAGLVLAIEKDPDMIVVLKERFKKALNEEKLIIIESDVLDFDTETVRKYRETYKIVANIPYYITGQILRKFLTDDFQPENMVLLVQKEVAQRIVARENKESVLSLSVKAYGVPSLVSIVKKQYFSPPPKVDSAIIKVESISKDFFKGFSEEIFFNYVKQVFSQKRKQFLSTFKPEEKTKLQETLEKHHLEVTVRPEAIPLKVWPYLISSLE